MKLLGENGSTHLNLFFELFYEIDQGYDILCKYIKDFVLSECEYLLLERKERMKQNDNHSDDIYVSNLIRIYKHIMNVYFHQSLVYSTRIQIKSTDIILYKRCIHSNYPDKRGKLC